MHNNKSRVTGFFFALFIFPASAVPYTFSNLSRGNDLPERQPRQGLFNIINFPNLPCRGNNNLNGTCVSSSECIGGGGQAKGSCASGFGTCCFYFIQTCGGSIDKNQTYFQNPGYPATYSVSAAKECTYVFNKINTNVCQVRLDFETFDIGPPLSGTQSLCQRGATDYVTITHANGRVDSQTICGYNTGQHIYIDMEGSGTTYSSAFGIYFDASTYSNYPRKYNIMASQIECDAIYKAPSGCLQYFYGNGGQGVIMHFNYDQPNLNYIGTINGNYRVCIRREATMCTVAYTPPKFSDDNYGFTVNGGSGVTSSRFGCGQPIAAGCGDSYVRIPQATHQASGAGPYFGSPADPLPVQPAYGCDRLCGKRFCLAKSGCNGVDHGVIYSKALPFSLDVMIKEAGYPQSDLRKGFKLNYYQKTGCN